MGIQQDKLLNWLAVHSAQIAGDEWWESEFMAGRMAAYREIESLIHAGEFADLKG